MRTLEMTDKVFEQAEAEAKRRGVSLQAFVEDAVAKTLRDVSPAVPDGNRVDFPIIFTSKNPGVLKLTNEDIRRMEEEDDLRMLGMLD